jgi:hypothetical protein
MCQIKLTVLCLYKVYTVRQNRSLLTHALEENRLHADAETESFNKFLEDIKQGASNIKNLSGIPWLCPWAETSSAKFSDKFLELIPKPLEGDRYEKGQSEYSSHVVK